MIRNLTDKSTSWHLVLGVKITVVVVRGTAALAHPLVGSRRALAAFGAIAGLASLAALVLGVILAD